MALFKPSKEKREFLDVYAQAVMAGRRRLERFNELDARPAVVSEHDDEDAICEIVVSEEEFVATLCAWREWESRIPEEVRLLDECDRLVATRKVRPDRQILETLAQLRGDAYIGIAIGGGVVTSLEAAQAGVSHKEYLERRTGEVDGPNQ